MSSARGIGGVIGAIVWIMINDVAGGIAGLAVGWMAMASVEPMLGGWPAASCSSPCPWASAPAGSWAWRRWAGSPG